MVKQLLILGIAFSLLSFSGVIQADDTDIFGGSTVNVPPNVLIIFDNSYSMKDSVTNPYNSTYNAATTYPDRGYDTNSLYYSSGTSYILLATSKTAVSYCACTTSSSCGCTSNCSTNMAAIKTSIDSVSLSNYSVSISHMRVTSGTVSYTGSGSLTVKIGNYLNFLEYTAGTGTSASKFNIAQETICRLIDNTNGVRFGVMLFNEPQSTGSVYKGATATTTNHDGGRIVAEVKDWDSNKDDLKAKILNLPNPSSPIHYTPLAETLAEAGLYFARKHSYYNSDDYSTVGATKTLTGSVPYDEFAVQYRCQKNNIIIMTDGESSHDRDAILMSDAAQTYKKKTGTNTYAALDPYMAFKNPDGTTLNKYIGDTDGDVTSRHASELIGDASKDTTNHTGVYTTENQDYQGSDYLDDVARFLNQTDLLYGLDGSNNQLVDSSGISFDETGNFTKQSIRTYTIGFGTGEAPLAVDLLGRTADSTHGNGQYFSTSSTINLLDIFQAMIGNITETNSQYISPVVPVNRVNRTFSDNGLYLGIFAPESSTPGVWKGNIKKFGFSKTGLILDRVGDSAVNSDGSLKNTARSAWYDVGAGNADGMNVDVGGAGKMLLAQSSRAIKTFKNSTLGMMDVSAANANILPSDLGLCTTAQDTVSTNVTNKNDLINYITASGKFAPTVSVGGTGTDTTYGRTWTLGDIIHSQPAILYDTTNNKNILFIGANDGFLHCFVDWDKGVDATTGENDLSNDEIKEAWAFTPWDILSKNLKYYPYSAATTPPYGDIDHDIYIDGSPVVYKSGSNYYVAFGLRRGGMDLTTKTTTKAELANQYFILNINNFSSSAWPPAWLPSWSGAVSKDVLGGTEKLGQSWCPPHFCSIRTGSGANDKTDVLLLTGGYDINQDNTNPGSNDTRGRAVFAVDPSSGSLWSSFNFNNANYTTMKYCIVDLKSFDDNDDDSDDTVYAPSVGGELFAFKQQSDYSWSKRLLFNATNRGDTSKLRKFFYAPGIAQEIWGDWVYLGSGDRENPQEDLGSTVTGTKNRFYAIRNTWDSSWDDSSPITDGSTGKTLTDVTADALQGTEASPSTMSVTDKSNTRTSLSTTGNGWYIDMDRAEKVISTPLVYNKVVYFTTYTPTLNGVSVTDDPCGSTGSGTGKLYAVNYQTGEAVFKEFNGNSAMLTKEDRYVTLGSGIPSEPTLVTTKEGTFIVVGAEKGIISVNTQDTQFLKRYYWLKK